MDNMVVVVFDTESQAYEAVNELKQLEANGSIKIYSGGLITKDADGRVHLRESKEEWPIGMTVGASVGALLGALAGPAGIVAGGAIGALAGMPTDVYNLGVGSDFGDKVGNELENGKSAVIFEAEEEWESPIDSQMEKIGGRVFRTSRREAENDQFDG